MQPLIFITVGYITGILWGLYLKISIVPIIFLLGGGILTLSKRINIVGKYKWYLILLIISSFVSSIIIQNLENKFDTLYTNLEQVNVIGIIISEGKETDYKMAYTLKIENINGDKKYKNTKLIIYTKKDEKKLEYGEKIELGRNLQCTK